MTGPEHYRAAEEDIERANRANEDSATYYLQRAQVHATLALAAATAMAGVNNEMPVWDADAWQEAAGTKTEVIPRESQPQAAPCRHDTFMPLASMKAGEIARQHLDGRDRRELQDLLLWISGYCPDAVQQALDSRSRVES